MAKTILMSESRGIEQPRQKVRWAKIHLDLLYVLIGNFLDRDANRVSGKDDLDAGEYIISVNVDAVPADIILVLGDFISALRCSLDHLAGLLTRIPTGTPNLKASFPIIDEDNPEGNKLFIKSTKGIAPDAIPIIESLQPYHSGDAYKTTKLWKLNRLWNIDKHRRMPFHATIAKLRISFPSHVTPIFSGTDNSGKARFVLSDKPYIQFDPAIKIIVQFGDESEGIIIPSDELIDIYEFVNDDVFPKFERFF
jgi:hypothetical protein